ncbi:helix-turn-helix transcriptional regulator [Phytohabitans sp. LJ34]|uniref:helix-turn-helix transcriptional regulator n=1 Tax=Phytohabitans sp. LJ34 TaxID=3452217 RepID=UPI003F88B544
MTAGSPTLRDQCGRSSAVQVDRADKTWQPDPLLTIDQVAHWLGKPKNTLYAWHSRGKGPRYPRRQHLAHRRSEVERWLDEHTDQRR